MLHKWLKPLALTLALWAGLAAPAFAFGTLPLSMVQQFDSSGHVMAGCLLYFYQAGTVSTPQNAYSDTGLTQALPNPLSCDATGRVPQFWLADGLIHIRLTDSSGVVVLDTTMQVLGPSSGSGGGGSTVDPTTLMATGDIKVRYGTGPLSGFVRMNGLTIGNASSGATERANADTQNLFVYLYNTDPNLVVSGGRTGNALNDYNAGKTLALPDMRGRTLAGLADMGNSATSTLTTAYAGCSSVTTLGETCGSQNHTQTQAELPAVAPTFTGTPGTATSINTNIPINSLESFSFATGNSPAITGTVLTNLTSSFTPAGTISNLGSGNPFTLVNPEMLITTYIKL